MQRLYLSVPSPAALRGVYPHAIFIARDHPIKFTLIVTVTNNTTDEGTNSHGSRII